MVQDQNIDLRQIGIQADFFSAAPAHPTVWTIRLLRRFGTVGETDHVGACGTEASSQCCSKGSTSACDADPFSVEG